MLSTEFQLIHLHDFLHLIERSVKEISLAACSKNRRDTEDVNGKTRTEHVFNELLTEIECFRFDFAYFIPFKKVNVNDILLHIST